MSVVAVNIPAIIPEPPTSVSADAVNSTALEVTWTPSDNTEYYQVAWESHVVNVSLNETTYLITGLAPGTNYSISVAACASRCSDSVIITNNTCKD